MSNQTEWQKWCAETAPVMAAAGRGEVVRRFVHDDWEEKEDSTAFCPGAKYRIKPRTVRIGEYDVPEPMREAPEVGSIYYVARCHEDAPFEGEWTGRTPDKAWLNMGVMHSKREAAYLHGKALRSLTEKKD